MMHWILRRTLRDVVSDCERTNVLRSDDESIRVREQARAARVLLLHNASDVVVEKWLAVEFPAPADGGQ